MTGVATEVLAQQIKDLTSQISELKGRFDTFQSNFLRNDLYTVRHEELVQKVEANNQVVNGILADRKWLNRMIVAAAASGFFLGLASFLVAILTRVK